MRLTLAGSLVLIWSAVQLKSQVLDIWRDKKNYLPFLAYAILGIFSVQYFFYLCVEYSNAATATILQFYQSCLYSLLQSLGLSKTSVKKRYFLCFGCHVGCLPDGYKGDLSQLSMTPLALITGLLSAMGVMFNVILPQPFAKRYGFVPTVGWGMIWQVYLAMSSRRFISFPLLWIFGVS